MTNDELRTQPIEEMMAILEAECTNPERLTLERSVFQRVIRFTACGVSCWIEWWRNVAYLHIGSRYSSTIIFHSLEPNMTWPSFERGLEFVNDTVPHPRVFVATKLLDWQKEKQERESGYPICFECKHPFVFDRGEPFAHCLCGTTEWGDGRPEHPIYEFPSWREKVEAMTLTLCGSTRFRKAYEEWNEKLTLAGYCVFSVGLFVYNRGVPLTVENKVLLDEVHLRKIDQSAGIVVVDVNGYIGDSTLREIAHAEETGKAVYRISDGTADAMLASKEDEEKPQCICPIEAFRRGGPRDSHVPYDPNCPVPAHQSLLGAIAEGMLEGLPGEQDETD